MLALKARHERHVVALSIVLEILRRLLMCCEANVHNVALCLVYYPRRPWFQKLVRLPSSVRLRVQFYRD